MASIFERIENRKALKVVVGSGELYVREPTFGDIARVRAMVGKEGDLSTGLSLALCVVTENGQPEFPPSEGESDEDLARRVMAAANNLTPSMLREINLAIEKLTKPVDAGELEKN